LKKLKEAKVLDRPKPPLDMCPHCEHDLLYKVDGKTYSKLVGLEIQGGYDGVSYWACPFCQVVWDRFTGKLQDWKRPQEEKKMSEWKTYRKVATQQMRPYVPGENLEGISVSGPDVPEPGGMIAQNPKNPADQWYVSKKFFEENYELVS
jgi:hypothetical protein